jgi:hypothetical protein
LANLYHKQQNLFSKIIEISDIKSIYDLFDISVSDYWKTHYTFDKASPKKSKSLSKSFVDLLIINTIIPIKFAYTKSIGKEISEELIDILNDIAPENNSIIDKFATFGIKSKSAFETQSLLQLKNEYCNKQRCLDCAVGSFLMR